MILFLKEYRNRYINIVWGSFTTNAKLYVRFAYNNKQIQSFIYYKNIIHKIWVVIYINNVISNSIYIKDLLQVMYINKEPKKQQIFFCIEWYIRQNEEV